MDSIIFLLCFLIAVTIVTLLARNITNLVDPNCPRERAGYECRRGRKGFVCDCEKQ